MRQSGVLAAMCLYALDHHVERLAEDHALASTIAARIADLPHIASVTAPQTNLLFFTIDEHGGLRGRRQTVTQSCARAWRADRVIRTTPDPRRDTPRCRPR